MKKILFVTDAWAPQVNGVVRVLTALIPILESRGYEIVIIEPGQFKTVPMPFYKEIRLALFRRRRIERVLREQKPDAVCIVTEGSLGWAARSVCQTLGIPFVSWYHSHFQLYVDVRFYGLMRPIFAFIRRFHSAGERTMVSTESLKKELERGGFKNLVIMPLGVDTKLFTRAKITRGTLVLHKGAPCDPCDFPKPLFVYLSRLALEKNPEDFLKLDLPGTKLVIGDGPLRKKLEREYGDTHIFVGYKRGQELVDWLSLADVLVFPSRTETFGLVALEALACGVPVAAYDVMGPRDIVTNGVDGFLGEDLRQSAIACLDLSREDCRKKSEQYSWERSADVLIKNLSLE